MAGSLVSRSLQKKFFTNASKYWIKILPHGHARSRAHTTLVAKMSPVCGLKALLLEGKYLPFLQRGSPANPRHGQVDVCNTQTGGDGSWPDRPKAFRIFLTYRAMQTAAIPNVFFSFLKKNVWKKISDSLDFKIHFSQKGLKFFRDGQRNKNTMRPGWQSAQRSNLPQGGD